MAYTRVELQAQIDAVFVENGNNAISASQINGILSNILNSVTLQDESTAAIEVASLNISDPATGLMVEGTKVIGCQQPVIDDLTAETATAEQAAEGVNAILEVLRTHGLIDTEDET